MTDITADRVKQAMISSNIDRVDHHECAGCGYMVNYTRYRDQLYFNPGCGCSWGASEPRSWQEAADWINMQTNPEVKEKLMKSFGIQT